MTNETYRRLIAVQTITTGLLIMAAAAVGVSLVFYENGSITHIYAKMAMTCVMFTGISVYSYGVAMVRDGYNRDFWNLFGFSPEQPGKGEKA
jgi:hypothetical protein